MGFSDPYFEKTLKCNDKYCSTNEPIYIELKVASSLRILYGGCINDVREIFGISNSHQYYIFHHFLEAVLKSKDLEINLPKPEELEKLRMEFSAKSRFRLMNGCIGAIDGFFQKTIAPKKNETGNTIAYYSGHYESYGLNCQAVCDANLRFLFFAVVSPGSTNDNIAFAQADGLKQFIDKLPHGMYVLGDAAYTVSDKLLTPFVGSQKNDPNKDAFNFYLSQLRICSIKTDR